MQIEQGLVPEGYNRNLVFAHELKRCYNDPVAEVLKINTTILTINLVREYPSNQSSINTCWQSRGNVECAQEYRVAEGWRFVKLVSQI